MTTEPSGPKPLLVLGKITDILDAFTLQRPVLSLGELQQATGIPTSCLLYTSPSPRDS